MPASPLAERCLVNMSAKDDPWLADLDEFPEVAVPEIPLSRPGGPRITRRGMVDHKPVADAFRRLLFEESLDPGTTDRAIPPGAYAEQPATEFNAGAITMNAGQLLVCQPVGKVFSRFAAAVAIVVARADHQRNAFLQAP